MIHSTKYGALVCFLLLAGALALACAATPDRYQEVERRTEMARSSGSDEGTAITAKEGEWIAEALPEAPFDWLEAAETLGQIGLTLLGVKILPGSLFRGPWDRTPVAPPAPAG